jgi:hypothetical protein
LELVITYINGKILRLYTVFYILTPDNSHPLTIRQLVPALVNPTSVLASLAMFVPIYLLPSDVATNELPNFRMIAAQTILTTLVVFLFVLRASLIPCGADVIFNKGSIIFRLPSLHA